MYAVPENGRDRNDFPGHWNPLYKGSVLQQRTCAAAPSQREEIERHQTAQNERRKMRLRVAENLREDESESSHGDQRIQQRPEDPQGHVAVTDFEIFLDEIAK